jgi:putative RNA 2'-phosphotransferase
LKAQSPPEVLYHGTATRFLDSIKGKGIMSMTRQHVHLSADMDTALTVARRHGKPVILKLDTTAMVEAGFSFYLSANSVWLSSDIPFNFVNEVIMK